MYRFLIPLFALAFLIIGCSEPSAEAPKEETPPAPAPNLQQEEKKPEITFNGEMLTGTHTIIFKTTAGEITAELYADSAPKTVTNFIGLAQSGYYNGLTFHRVIPDFMIQGGDPNGDGTGGDSIFGNTFEDEINADTYGLHEKLLRDNIGDQTIPDALKDATIKDYLTAIGYVFNAELESLPLERGALAMANRGPNTNGSQFFIIQREEGTPWLEGKHTVFGKVTKGLDIVDAIANSDRDARDMPVESITMEIEIVKQPEVEDATADAEVKQ